jgi:CRISPR-associated protein Csb1
LAPRAIARAIFALDPFCLIHGVFFSDSKWIGQPKVLRAITANVEARDVREAVSGGVKRDHVRLSLEGKSGGTAEGYGSVPFSRVEYTAASIEASFVLDRAQLDAYGLPTPARDLLENIALWEIRTLLDGGLRLRTACDLEPLESWEDDRLPQVEDLESTIQRLTEEVLGYSDEIGPVVPNPGPLEVRWRGGQKNSKKAT